MHKKHGIITIFIILACQTPESRPSPASGITGFQLWHPASERPWSLAALLTPREASLIPYLRLVCSAQPQRGVYCAFPANTQWPSSAVPDSLGPRGRAHKPYLVLAHFAKISFFSYKMRVIFSSVNGIWKKKNDKSNLGEKGRGDSSGSPEGWKSGERIC